MVVSLVLEVNDYTLAESGLLSENASIAGLYTVLSLKTADFFSGNTVCVINVY
jgi:hypothetical protein